MRRVVGFVVCLGFLVACSDSSDPTDPGSNEDPNQEDPIEDPTDDPDPDPDPDPNPDEAEVPGTWTYEAPVLKDADSGATCAIDNATLTLTEDGDAITGKASGRLSCSVDGQDWEWDRDADVEDVVVDGEDLGFVFTAINSTAERAEVEHEGTIDGDSMTGTATLFYDDFVLTGDWTATRDD